MVSVLIGSFPRPLSSLSFPVASELSSLTTGGNGWRSDNFKTCHFPSSHVAVHVSRCRAWNIVENYYVTRFHHVGSIDERSAFYRRRNTKYLMNAASGHPLESESGTYHPKSPRKSVQDSLNAFYRFSRPHTVIGTALSIISVSLLAVEKLSDFSPLFFNGTLEAVVAALLMNIYIVGLNQLSDIEIDKVNKPYLPLASGEFSVTTGVTIVSSFAIMSFWLGWIVGSWPLFWALFVSFILGTAYSINTFVYRRPAVFSRPLIFATAFMSFFSVVIALFKDIPDIDGDKIYGIRSFTVRLGQKRVFWICISLLQMAYGVAILVGATSSCLWSKYVMVLGHAALASILWNRAKSIDLKSKAAITAFYMFIWKLFYAEYLLIPLVR
uniref:Homogentisate phytyltransferase n=1 Tax=Davidia involucrata TaxID=16924 RepID=A0A5B7B6Y1_DAVIN